MSVAILLITHHRLGQPLIDTAKGMLTQLPTVVQSMDVPLDSQPEQILMQGQDLCHHLDQGDGVLILSDLYGSTPGNISLRLCSDKVYSVFGVNLAMLIKALNYCHLPIAELSKKAMAGGIDSIQKYP